MCKYNVFFLLRETLIGILKVHTLAGLTFVFEPALFESARDLFKGVFGQTSPVVEYKSSPIQRTHFSKWRSVAVFLPLLTVTM